MTPDEYLKRSDDAFEGKAKQASFLVSQPLQKSPDEYAQSLTMAKSLGLPPVLVDANYKSFAQRVTEKRNETILKSSPVLTDWIAKDDNFRIAADKIEELSWWELLPHQAAEMVKGVPGGVVSTAGTAMEGTGQLLTPRDPADRLPLARSISGAAGKSAEEIAALRQEIFKQGVINPQYAQSILSDVLDGSMTPDQAMEALEPALGPMLGAASDWLQSAGQSTQEYGEGILPAAPGMEESFGREVGSGLGSLLTILGVGLVTGGTGAAGFGAMMGAGEASARARKAGQDEDTQTIAAVYGMFPGLTEAVPIERILNNPVTKAGFASLMRSIGKQVALEGGQEAVQELLQNAIAQNLYAPDQGLFEDVARSFQVGGFIGGLVEAGRIGFNAALPGRFRSRQAGAQQAEQAATVATEISQQAQASGLRQRSPDKFREYLERATEGTDIENVYIPAEQFQEYFQDLGVDPYSLIDDLDGVTRDDFDVALAGGGDLRIPTATYAARMAGTEHDAFLIQNMRFSPDAQTATEAAAFNERFQELQREAFEEAERQRQEDERYRSFEQEIYETMLSQARVAGRSLNEAENVAQLYVAEVRTAAADEGMTIDEYLAKYPLPEVQGSIPQGFQTRNVDALTRTLAEARNRRAAGLDKRGPSLLEFISDRGGILDRGGELRARNADVIKRGRGKKTLRLLRDDPNAGTGSMFGGGASVDEQGRAHGVDDVALAAIEAGYLRDHPVAQEYVAAMERGDQVPDITLALWDAIDEELRGNVQFSGDFVIDQDAIEGEKAFDEINEYLDRLGVSIDDSDDVIRAAVEKAREEESRKYGQASDENMIVQHNLSVDNLLHADKMRGLAVPSVAVSNVDYPLDGFGEVTLLGGPDMVDPRKDRAAKVFDADVYSPRYPSVRYKIAKPVMNKVWKELDGVSVDLGHVLSGELDNSEVERSGLSAFRDSSAVQLQFLRDTGRDIAIPQEAARSNYLKFVPELSGMSVDSYAMNNDQSVKDAVDRAINFQIEQILDASPDVSADELRSSYYMRDGSVRRSVIEDINQEKQVARNPGVDRRAARQAVRDAVALYADEFSSWVDRKFGDVIAGEQIETRTASGNWKYLPHTLDNVVKVLKSKLRDGEGFNYGVGSIRSTVANQFKNVAAIQKSRGKLIPADDMKALKDEVDNEFVALAGKFAEHAGSLGKGFGWLDIFSERLKEVAERGVGVLNSYEDGVPTELAQEAVAFLDKLANMPTEYFEAKIQRAVGIDEFKAAVLPKNAKKEVRDVLKYAGVPVFEYDPNVENSRAAAIKRAAGQERLLFQRDLSITETDAFKEWFGDSKVVDADGKPLVVYHGTGSDIEAFEMRKAHDKEGRRRGLGLGAGKVYLSGNSYSASNYAEAAPSRKLGKSPNVMPLYVRIEKPITQSEYQERFAALSGGEQMWSPDLTQSRRDAIIKQLDKEIKKEGYDGIIDSYPDGDGGIAVGQVAVFSPDQIKSVHNRGTFDPADPRILYQQGGTGNRGSLRIMPDGKQIISLFENANLSTFLHETGHVWLTNLQSRTADGSEVAADRMEQIKAWWRSNAKDVAKDAMRVAPDVKVSAEDVIAALDNGTTGDNLKDVAIDAGMQEQFARAAEVFLMEGKAPTAELQTAFDRFRSWLLAVYERFLRAVGGDGSRALGVNVSPEIKAVFDRILATEAELANARERSGDLGSVFASAEQMGLTDEEYARFLKLRERSEGEAKARLYLETMRPERVKATKEYKAERAKVREEIEREVNAYRQYRAHEWMANRRWLGENQPENMPDMRMSKDILVERYGEGILSTLPRGLQTVYAVKGGSDPDDLAGWFGFDSGDEMVRAMEVAPPRKEAIEAETDKRMRELHGDPLNDGSIEAAALDAVHTDRRGEWLAAELKAVAEVSGLDVALTARDAREGARQSLNRMRVRDAMSSQRFLAAERKAGEEAARLGRMLAREKLWADAARRRVASKARQAVRGDATVNAPARQIDQANRSIENYNETVQKFVQAKRRQLVNHALYMESRKVADEVEKAENYVAKLNRKTTRDKIAGAGRRENAQVDYLGAIDDILERYDFRRISGSAEERRASLAQFIEAMKAAGRENELAIPDAVIENASRKPYKTLPVEEMRGVIDSLKNLEHIALRWNTLIDAQNERQLDAVTEEIAAAFDENMPKRPPGRVGSKGEDRRNKARQLLDVVLNAGTLLREIDGFKDFGAAYRNLKTPIDQAMDRLITRKEKAAGDLETLYSVYSKEERRRMAVREHIPALGYSLSKWERIAIALNTGNEGNYQRLTDERVRGAMTEAQVSAVLSSLDQRDADFVQSVWDYLETFRDDIAAREKRTTGVEPKWVEARPVEVGGKLLTGGYYPLRYDPRLSSLARDDETQEIAQSLQAGRFGKAQTRNGHLKERAQASGRDVELDMSVLHKHINQVIYDLELSEPVANSWRILQDSRVRGSFMEAGRQADFDALETWLKDVAEGELRSADMIQRMARSLKSNFTAAKLAFNLSTVAVQVTGLPQSMVIVGKKNMAKGIMQTVANPFSKAEDIAAKSAFMRSRQTTFNKDIYDMFNDPMLGPVASRWNEARNYLAGKLGMWLMTKVQFYVVDVPTWLAGYNQGMKKFGNDEDKAIAHADAVVKRAQASGLFSDRSAVERGSTSRTSRQNDVVRMFTALGSYMFAKFNVAYERSMTARRVVSEEGLSMRSLQEVLSWTLDMAFLFTVEAVLYAAIKGKLPDDDDDEDDGWAAFLAKESAFSVMSTIPFVRDVGSTLSGFEGGGAYGAITKEIAAPLVQLGQGDLDKALVKSIINGTGLATGMPSSQINRAVDAGWRQMEGEDVSPLEYLLGRMGKQ